MTCSTLIRSRSLVKKGSVIVRDWSLITGRGGGGVGLQNGRGGGQVKFYPYKKGGGKSFSHAEGGHKMF